MLIQFVTESDNQIYIADTLQMAWARVSAPHNDPNSVVEEAGKLVPQGFGIYALDGRIKPGQTEGLATIGIFVVAIGTTVKIFLRANVQVKDFTMPVPINQVLYEILPSDPQQVAQAVGAIQEANNAANDSGNPDSVANPSGNRALPAPEPEGSQAGPETTGTPGTDGEDSGGTEGNA